MDVAELVQSAQAAVDQLQSQAQGAVASGLQKLVDLGQRAQAELDQLEGEDGPDEAPVAGTLPAEPQE